MDESGHDAPEERSTQPRCGLFTIECNWFAEVGYGDSTTGGSLREKMTRRKAALLDALGAHLEVVDPGFVGSTADVRHALLRFSRQEVDFVLVAFATWAEDFTLVRFLRDADARLPIVFYCFQSRDLPFRENVGAQAEVDYLNNTSLVGSLQGSGSFARIRGDRTNWITLCGPQDEALPRILTFARAAAARSRLRRARIAALRSMNDQMWSTYVDLYRFFAEVGPSVTFLPFTALADADRAVSPQRVAAERQRLLELMDVDAGADDERLDASVRASLAVEDLAREQDFDAVALNDVDENLHRALGLRPGFYPRGFFQDRRVAVPEADIAMAALALALTTSTGSRFMYTEPFFTDIESNTFLGGHAGPNDPSIPGVAWARISEDLEYRDSGHRYAGAPFAWFEFPHGPATICHMSEKPAGYAVVSAFVECVPTAFTLHGYPFGAFRPQLPVSEFFERVMQVGTTQHFLAFPGDVTPAIEALARVNEWEYVPL